MIVRKRQRKMITKAIHLRGFLFGVILLGLMISGCAPSLTTEPVIFETEPVKSVTEMPALTMTITSEIVDSVPLQVSQAEIFLTYPNLNGNRIVEGAGFQADNPVEIPLMGKPVWVVAAALDESSIWYVALETGQIQAFQIQAGVVTEVKSPSALPPGMPPVLVSLDDVPTGILQPEADAAIYTNPLLLQDGRVVFLRQDGSLSIIGPEGVDVFPIDVLPDARILSAGDGRLMVLSSPSDKYPHAIMGDALEATGITIIDTAVDPVAVQEIKVATGDVIEGLSPIWTDMDGDGQREIIVTQSNAESGSRIVVYGADGNVLAQGDPIGEGFRWIHQVAVGQFIEGGVLEIAAVRTPHIGGVVQIYALDGNRLVVVDSLSGFSSHRIGSRNLDGALAGDFNGDGLVELVVPDQVQTNLHGIQFTQEGLISVWNVLLESRLSTNLVSFKMADGSLVLGAGTEDNLLIIWDAGN